MKKHTFLIYLLFFFSGLTSLIFETVWIRVLGLALGSSAVSISLVFSAFFLGLAIGSYFSGKFIHRTDSPVFIYGALEAFVGIASILLIYIFFNFAWISQVLPNEGPLRFLSDFIQYGLGFLFLLVPTICMGASLPILVRIFHRQNDMGKIIGRLYSVNTFGGVVGAAITGFLLIPHLGVVLTNHFAAVLNLGIFATIWLLHSKQDRSSSFKLNTNLPPKLDFSRKKSIYLAAGISGLTSIAAEVVWSKYLGIFLGSNIYGLSLVVALFLLGIGMGSWVASVFLDRWKHQSRKLLICFLLANAVGILVATKLLNFSPILANVFYYWSGHITLFHWKVALSAVALFLPTALMGALLPLCIFSAIDDYKESAAQTGRIYSINTIGSILGSSLSGLVLIPLIGSGHTLQLSVFLLVLLALVFVARGGWRKSNFTLIVSAIAVLILGYTFQQSEIGFKNIIRSAYIQTVPASKQLPDLLKAFSEEHEEFEMIYEGRSGIISLSHDQADGPQYKRYMRLKTNGLNESIYQLDYPKELPKYEALLGILPLATVRSPSNAFVVGYGGGFTVDFLTSNGLRNVFVAELEQGILKASDFVYKGKNPILARPNLTVEVEDARRVLVKGNHKFDIIISQPSHSWLSGVANLFTLEFFRLVEKNLSEKGAYAQWLNLYNMNPEVLNSILKTFFTVFPEGAVFTNNGDTELVLIGSKKKLQFFLPKLEAIVTAPINRTRLNQAHLMSAADVLAQFTLSRKEALDLAGDAPENTDRNAFAEVKQSKLFYQNGASQPLQHLLNAYRGSLSDIVVDEPKNKALFEAVLESFRKNNESSQKMNVLFDRLLYPSTKMAETAIQLDRLETAKDLLSKLTPQEAYPAQLKIAARENNWQKILKVTEGKNDWTSLCHRAEAALATNQDNAMKLAVAKLFKDYEKAKDECGSMIFKVVAAYHIHNRNFNDAIAFLYPYLLQNPYDVTAYRQYLQSSLEVKSQDVRTITENYLRALNYEKDRLQNLAVYLEAKGLKSDAENLRNKATELH